MTGTRPEQLAQRSKAPVTRHGTWQSQTQVLKIEFPGKVELHIRARPRAYGVGFSEQARSAYRALYAALAAHDGAPRDLLTEKAFLSHLADQMPLLQGARRDFYLSDEDASMKLPAMTYVEQPPARPGQDLEIQAYAVIPTTPSAFRVRSIADPPPGVTGNVVEIGDLRHVYIGNITGEAQGDGGDRRREATSMFERAETCLNREGLTFRDVVRTWIYAREMADTYDDLNWARTTFFQSRGIAPFPASTGIQAIPFPPNRTYSLDIRAVASPSGIPTEPIHATTLNEAPEYGSAFSRGMRVELDDREILYISGTASIDALGRVAHVDDIQGQIVRMLVNIKGLLASHGATLQDVVSATCYLKHPRYLNDFMQVGHSHGLPDDVPGTVCVAEVCRPDWLCEIDVTAVLV
jgi:enamine deaminase RidA (YjgF/YER057c/UK114 family)